MPSTSSAMAREAIRIIADRLNYGDGARPVEEEDLKAHLSRMRSEGFPFLSGGLGVELCLPMVGVVSPLFGADQCGCVTLLLSLLLLVVVVLVVCLFVCLFVCFVLFCFVLFCFVFVC